MKSFGVTIQMKPLQQYFHMMLFVLYIVLTFESTDEILWYYQSNETFSAVLSQGRFTRKVWILWKKSSGVTFQEDTFFVF